MELVIVIAVIAVLAAVLIPTFANITERANTSADTQTVKNLNTILISEETLGNKPATMAEALAVAESGGYKVENLTPTGDGNHIVWLKERNRFALLDENEELVYSDSSVTTLEGLTAYKMSSTLEDLGSDDSFAYCFTSETEVGDGAVEVSRSADFSLVEGITGITVNNDSAMEITAEGEDIAVTVNGTATLGIYGTVGSISGEDYGNESLHIYGTVTGKIELAAGRVVAMPGSDINTITVTAESSEDVTIVRQSGSVISAIGATDEEVAANLEVEGDDSDIDISKSAVSNDFAGGMGTEANPYLISTPAQLTKINNIYTHYKLTNDIYLGMDEVVPIADASIYGIGVTGTGVNMALAEADALKASASVSFTPEQNFVLDGDGYTVYGPENNILVSKKKVIGTGTITEERTQHILFRSLTNATIKNITFNMTPVMPTIAASVEGATTFENVTFTGTTNWENNTGLFGIYVNKSKDGVEININNCVNNANIVGTAYNALMFGYPHGKVTVKVDGFTNNGRYVDDRAAIVFGNSSGISAIDNEFVIEINNFVNKDGAITSLSSAYTNPYIASLTHPSGASTMLTLKVNDSTKVDGVVAAENISDETAYNNLISLKTSVEYCGVASPDSSLSLTQNEDKTFTITQSSNESAAYYIVMLRTYASTSVGTLLYTIQEKVDGESLVTELKNIKIIDDQTVEDGYTLTDEVYNGIQIAEKDGEEFYVYDVSGSQIDGEKSFSVKVYACDENGIPLSLYEYSAS